MTAQNLPGAGKIWHEQKERKGRGKERKGMNKRKEKEEERVRPKRPKGIKRQSQTDKQIKDI